MKNEASVGKEERHVWDFGYRYFYFLFPKDINYFPIRVAPAWIETDYSKHMHFRWKIKWRLEHLSALGIVGECATPSVFLTLVLSRTVASKVSVLTSTTHAWGEGHVLTT